MKVRAGFVSNSSTSSFSIFGVDTDDSELVRILFGEAEIIKEKGCSHEFDRDSKKFCSECGKQAWNEYEKEYDYEDIENALGEKGLDYVTCGENDEGPYVGWSLAGKGGKRAAKKQLEELNRINDLLKEMFGREGDFYSGSYYS